MSRSVQPFWQGSRSCPTQLHTQTTPLRLWKQDASMLRTHAMAFSPNDDVITALRPTIIDDSNDYSMHSTTR